MTKRILTLVILFLSYYNSYGQKGLERYSVDGDFILANDSTIKTGIQHGTLELNITSTKFQQQGSSQYLHLSITSEHNEPVKDVNFWKAEILENGNYRLIKKLTQSNKQGIAKLKINLSQYFLVMYYPSYTIKIFGTRRSKLK